MSNKPRPGSMGAAEAKSTRRWFIGASVVVGLILLMSVTNLFNTYLHDYYKASATWSKVVGFITLGGWYLYLWKFSYDFAWGKRSSANANIAILLVVLVLGFGFLYGFRFDL